ncbi:DUF1501 domain-containing protein [Silvibacterium sp.]|uniref:DUF1501 domain-containing protein n=1 Tax=Silvibacterium sp. TaxID=1964179 RepID=UPI0039E66C67
MFSNFSHPSRRGFLRMSGAGFGHLALTGLLGSLAKTAAAADLNTNNPLAPKRPPLPTKVKRIIFLFMEGAMSSVDTFEYKPELWRSNGKPGPGGGTITASKFKFSQYGQSGAWFSELLPNIAAHADEYCFLRGLYTDTPAHPQAVVQLHTGSANASLTRPSMGSWLLYGLGTENQNLPGYITINPPVAFGGASNYGSAFLPAYYQGTPITDKGVMPNIQAATSRELERQQIDLIQDLNREVAAAPGAPEAVEGVIKSYELGFRMQDTVPDLLDISKEPQHVLDAYGVKPGLEGSFARQCLMARRLSEAGVRFVEIRQPGWDHHTNLHNGLIEETRRVDQPTAALLADLKQRGLLDETLVLFGSEFGRLPTSQGDDGRDHNVTGYAMFMAGAGVRKGYSHGNTDELGMAAVEGRMHINDLHATLLGLMGIDHEHLTYRYAGRDFRLTDVAGVVQRDVFA